MTITFDEEEIAHIVADYAKRELGHEIGWDGVSININGEGDEQTVTASFFALRELLDFIGQRTDIQAR